MKFDLTRPCPKCPFRCDIPGYLNASRASNIATVVIHQNGIFSCHQTLDYANADENEGEATETAKTSMCAGALIMSEKVAPGHNQMVRIAERLGMYDWNKMDMDAPVFDSITEMVNHHARRESQ